MSLFSDALREAERQRTGRASTESPGLPVRNLVPDPDGRGDAAAPSARRVGAGAALVVVLFVIGWGVSAAAHRASAAKPVPSPHASLAGVAPSSSMTQVAARQGDSIAPVAPVESSPPAKAPPAQAPPAKAPPTKAPPSVDTAFVAAAPPAPPIPRSALPARPVARRDSANRLPITATSPMVVLQADVPRAKAVADSDARHATDPTASGLADSLFRMAYTEQMTNNVDGALALYERVIATTRAPAEAYNNFGVLLSNRGDRAAATEMFRQALNRDDKSVEAWVNLGDSFNGTVHPAGAMAAYMRANQLDPTRAAVKLRIAREYDALGDTVSAHRYLDDAIKASPNDADAHYSLGAFLQRAQDYHGAIREFETFVDLSAAKNGEESVADVRRHINALKQLAP